MLSNEPHSTAEACADITSCDDASAKCKETDLLQLVQEQKHLSEAHEQTLQLILTSHLESLEGLNDKELGMFPNRECHIDLMLGVKPHHIKQPCAVPLNQCTTVKNELFWQVQLGIIVGTRSTEWGMPMFVVPKPDGSCRIIADF